MSTRNYYETNDLQSTSGLAPAASVGELDDELNWSGEDSVKQDDSHSVAEKASSDSYEYDNVYTSASRITLGSLQEHSITAGDVDWVYFDVTSSGQYVFETTGSGDTTMTLYNSSRTELAYNDDGGSNRNARISQNLSTGRYYVRVQAYSSTASISSYGLSVSFVDSYEPDNTSSTASYISVGSNQTHNLSAGDVDWVYFDITTPGQYMIETTGSGDTTMTLYNSSLSQIAYNDDGGSDFNARISGSFTAGRYYVKVQAYNSSAIVNGYGLRFTDAGDSYESDNSLSTARLLTVGSAQSHSLHSASDQDWVYIQVSQSGDYTIQTEGSGDTLISLYNQNGSILDSDDDGGVGRNASLTYRLQAGTRYYARVTAYGQAVIPSYTLSLTRTSNGGDAYEPDNSRTTAGKIVAGETQSHSIHVAGDEDWIRIRPVQSGSYQIQTSGDGDMKLDLYAANGTTLLASDDDSGVGLNARIGYNLTANTDYYIKAYAYNSSSVINEYGVGVTLMASQLGDEYENDNSPTSAKSISLGVTQTHSIHTTGDVDWVTFTPRVSAEYTIQTVGSGLNCDTQLYLYSSLSNAQADNYLQWDDDSGTDRNALVTRVLNAGTTYYIKARAWSTYTIPSYGLKITQNSGTDASNSFNGDEYESDNLSGECKPIAVGREYTHSIHVRSDTDWVRFFTHQTGTYTIQTTGDSDMSFIIYKREPGGPLVPYERGEEISYGGAAQNALYRVRLETDNWYYVRVTTNNRQTTSPSYGIRVDIDPSSVAGDQYEKLGGRVNDNAPSRANWLTLGYSQVHSIHTPGDTDWIVYKADNSGEILFSADNAENKEMRLFLYRKDANGNLSYITETQFGSYGHTAATLATEAGELYYCRVQALSPTDRVQTYTMQATYVKDSYEDDDTSAKGTVLTLANSQSHNIHSQNDQDWYKFTVTTSGVYEFETTGNGDTYGILYRNTNGSNSLVTQTGSGGSGRNFKICQNLSAGTYYLRVSGENSSLVENYTITARRPITAYNEPNDSMSSATTIALNATATGSFHNISDIDYYKISSTQNGSYTFQASSSSIKIDICNASNTVVATGVGNVSYQNTGTGPLYARLSSTNGEMMDSYTIRASYAAPASTNRAENYFIYFAGGAGYAGNTKAFYLNMKDVYEKVAANYDIPAEHIYILYADGLNEAADFEWRGVPTNGSMDFVQPGVHVYSATKANLSEVMYALRNTDSNDHVLVYTEDHGSGSSNPSVRGEEKICTWSGSYISGAEFESMASQIGAGYQTYLFAQCYAGGILDALNIDKINSSQKKVMAVAADTHYETSCYIPSSSGEEIVGFVYNSRQFFSTGNNNSNDLGRYLVSQNRFSDDSPYYETNYSAGFGIFAQS